MHTYAIPSSMPLRIVLLYKKLNNFAKKLFSNLIYLNFTAKKEVKSVGLK